MATRSLVPTAAPKTYAELKRGVEETLLAGQRRVEVAKVLTYLETGRLINAHVLLNGGRATYGSQVLGRLARDLHIAPTTLYQCTQFARYFPILRHGGKLVWAHYRLLCQIEDEAQRNKLTDLTVKNGWTSTELQERVRALNATAAPVTSIAPATGRCEAR